MARNARMTGDRPRRRVIALNEQGYRIGQDHQRALLTDAQVEAMRDRHEHDGVGYRRLAREFGVPRSTARDICSYRRRNQYADRHKAVDK